MKIRLSPTQGELGETFEVLGSGWPPGSTESILLIKPVAHPAMPTPAAAATAGASGDFTAQVTIPTGQGWEAMPYALVEAVDATGPYTATARFEIKPPVKPISFKDIPSTEDRFALTQPAFLVFETEEAWTQKFGKELPPVKPAVNFDREIVLGAFLGEQPAGTEVTVSSIVLRDTTVSVLLTITSQPTAASGGPATEPRVLVTVLDSLLETGPDKSLSGLTFEFLNDQGEVLATGPAGSVQPVAAVSAPEEGAMLAPAPEATMLAETAAEAPQQVEQAPSGGLSAWLLFVIWFAVAVVIGVAAFVGVRLYLRRRGRNTPGNPS